MKLKPCPFCGSTEVDFDGTLIPIDVDNGEWTGDSWVICEGCGCSSAICDSEDAAANIWNTRVEQVVLDVMCYCGKNLMDEACVCNV